MAWRVKKKKSTQKKINIKKSIHTQQKIDMVFTKGNRQRRHTVILFTDKMRNTSQKDKEKFNIGIKACPQVEGEGNENRHRKVHVRRSPKSSILASKVY